MSGLTGRESITNGSYAITALIDRHGGDLESAAELPLPARVSGSISTSDDVDWFRLPLAEPTYLDIWTEGDTKLDGEFLQADGILDIGTGFDYMRPLGDGRNFHIEALLPAGTYYIKVERVREGGTFTPGTYSLVTARSQAFGHLALGARVSGDISRSSDRDYFRLQIVTPSIVTVRSEGSTDVDGRLLDAAGHSIAYANKNAEGGNFRMGRLLTAGTYYVEVDARRAGARGPLRGCCRGRTVSECGIRHRRFTGEIGLPGDADGYRLTVEIPTIATIWTEGDVSTVGRLLDADGREIASDNSSGEGQNFRIERALAPGTYFVEVVGAIESKEATGRYVLRTDTAPVPDLPFDTRVTGQIAPAGDYYRLTVDELKYVSIWTEGASDTAGVLYDEDGQLFRWVHGGGEGRNFRIERVLRPGTYYVGVREGAVGATGEYALAAESRPVPDIALGARVAGEISSADERYWYRLTLDTASIVSIWTEGGTDTAGILTDRDGHYRYSDTGDGDGENFRMERVLLPGTYYVVVSGQAGATGPYTLAVHADPGRPLTDGARLDGEIASAGDRHRYRVVVDEWEVLTVWTEGGTDTVGAVYDEQDNEVAFASIGGEGNNFGIQRVLGPGTYFVEVYGNRGATGAYVVASATTPVNDLAIGGQYYATINPPYDKDHYRLTVDTPMIVSVWTESRLNTVGAVLDEDGTTIWWERDGGEGENFRINRITLDPGTYYIEVFADRGTTGEYFVKAEGEPIPDLVLEADTLTAAVEGELESAEDRNVYRISVAEPVVASVFMSGPANPIGGVSDADSNGLDCCTGEGGNLQWQGPLSPGTYYISVVSGSRPRQTGTYDLSVVLEPANFANLSPGTPIAGEISRAGERDLYRLSIDSFSNARICTEAEFWTRGRLRDADGRVIWSAASDGVSGPNYCIERSLARGTYFVETYINRVGYETGAYTLEADVEPLPPPPELPFGSEIVTGRISRPGDTAWFSLTVDRPSAATVWTAGDTDTHGRLLDGDWNVIATDDDSGDLQNFRIERVLSPGTYYVEVSGDGNHTGHYAVFAASEPVLELTFGTPYADQIDPAGDTDWFGLDLQAPAIVTVWTEGEIDSYGRLFHGNGDEIAFDDFSGEDFNFRIERALPAGTYYVGVRGYDEDVTTGQYAIRADAVPIPDADDVSTVTDVTPLPIGERVAGQIGPSPGDRDYFRMLVEEPSIVTVWSEGDSDTDAWLFGEHQHRNAFDDDSGEDLNFRFERFLPDGMYYLDVSRPGSFSAGDIHEYVVAADARPVPHLALGRTAQGRIESGDEADLFVLAWGQPASVAIYTTGSLDTVGSLLDEAENELASDDDGGDGLNFHIEGERAAGSYLVRVNSFGSATGAYTLHARQYADVDLGETGGEAVRLWATAAGGWTLDPATGERFASGSEVVASNGATFVLELGADGIWTARAAAGSCAADQGWTAGTLAGTGVRGYGGDGGPASQAQLNAPTRVAVDAAGNVYVADLNNHRIRRIATDGAITTIAGTGVGGYAGDGGPATSAQLSSPYGVAVDAAGNVYVADRFNHRIRRIATDGTIATIAGTGIAGAGAGGYGGDGGPALQAQLNGPTGVAVGSDGVVYIADVGNHRIRRIATDGTIDTLAGTGTAGYSGDGGLAVEAQLNSPENVAVDAGIVYVADTLNHRIRRIDVNGTIKTIAGTGAGFYGGDGGPAVEAHLRSPAGIAVDAVGGVYVADYWNHRIRRIATDGTIATIAGTGERGDGGDGGPAADAQLVWPTDVAVDSSGTVYVADSGNHRVRALSLVRDDDHGNEAACATPLTLGVPAPGRIEPGDDSDWFRLELRASDSVAIFTTGDLDTVGSLRDESDTELAHDDDGFMGRNFQIDGDRPAGVYYIRVDSFDTATGGYTLHARRYTDVALGETGSTLRLWGMADGGWTLNPATDEPFESGGEVVFSNGDRYQLVQVLDRVWLALPVITPAEPPAGTCDAPGEWTIDTFAGTGALGDFGDGGPATEAAFNRPSGVAVGAGGALYVADGLNHRLRRIAPDGTIETFAGTGASGYGGDGGPATQARLNWPNGVAVDTAGNVYVADYANNRIRRIAPDGTIGTFAGTGQPRSSGDGGPAAQAGLNWPAGVAVDALGNVYVAEYVGNRIRRIRTDGTIETLAGTGLGGHSGDGGPATEAQIDSPLSVAVDIAGNVYIADQDNHRVRRIAPDGTIDTVAGTGSDGYGGDGGPATQALLNHPAGVAVDAAGRVYVADAGNDRLRRFLPGGIIETIAGAGGDGGFGGDGGPADLAQLDNPFGVAVDSSGNVYVADAGNQRIRVLESPADDHGDASACATVLQLGAPVAGEIELDDDEDWFRLDLSEAASVAIYTTGDVDTVGSLHGESGTRIASDDDGGDDTNFLIESDLSMGAYYIRVVSYRHPSEQGLVQLPVFGGGAVHAAHAPVRGRGLARERRRDGPAVGHRGRRLDPRQGHRRAVRERRRGGGLRRRAIHVEAGLRRRVDGLPRGRNVRSQPGRNDPHAGRDGGRSGVCRGRRVRRRCAP